MSKAIGYIRVSTQKQADEGVSLDAQRAKIEAWCLANDYDLTNVFCDEGISGTKSDRDGVLAAMAEAGKGTALVVYSLSRLTRSTTDLISFGNKLEKQGTDLISLSEKIDTTTAAGKMVFRLMGVFNEFERDQVAERTKAALAHKKANNQVYNHAPYGFKRHGTDLIPCTKERKVLTRINAWRNQGKSLRAIAGNLNDLGIASKRGGQWHASAVRSVINV
jgi:site-specific DNA recombinase|tara:strand:- start:823 stop:1482 length:660 start_codon:yes stop_codon:yes gene_type:complete